MRKWLLSAILTSVAGYAWKNKNRLFGGSRDDKTVSGPDRYNSASTESTQA